MHYSKPATVISAPLIDEGFASLECRVVDTDRVAKYSLFALEVVKAWLDPAVKNPQIMHHPGHGKFMLGGESIRLRSKMK